MQEIQPDEVCRNCGTGLVGKFCHSCGQKKIEPSERTFGFFFVQFLGSAFFLENNFLKNIWYVISHPGTQARDFIEGRQKKWMPPFSLFLLINLFYFWYTPLSDMNLSLGEQTAQILHGGLATGLTKARLENRQISFAEYEKVYNSKSSGYSTSLIIIHVPLLALIFMLFYRKKEYFFADFFIVSLYYFSFLLLMGLLIALVLTLLLGLIPSASSAMEVTLPWLLTVTLLTYSLIYLKNIFRQSWPMTVLKTIILLPGLFAVHLIYRAVQFFVIFLAT